MQVKRCFQADLCSRVALCNLWGIGVGGRVAEIFRSTSEKLAVRLSYNVVFNNLTQDVLERNRYDPATGELEQTL